MMAQERRATRATLSAYDADLRNFSEFLRGVNLESATPTDIQNYLKTQSHLSPTTIARRLSSLRQFYAYLVDAGVAQDNPLPLVKIAYPKTPSLSSLNKRLLEGAKEWKTPEGKRLCALLHMLQTTTLTATDVVALPYHDTLKKNSPLQDYLEIRSYFFVKGQESPWLFPSASQKGHLTPQRFGQLLKELEVKIGLDPTLISFATLRRE